MAQDDTPGVLGCNEGLGPLPEPQPRPGPDRLCGYSAQQMRAYAAKAVAAERERWEEALRKTWRMVDPLRPAGTPGSYARGQDSGIVAALETLRQNLGPNDRAERPAGGGSATPARGVSRPPRKPAQPWSATCVQ